MLSSPEELEYALLDVLAEAGKPMGSVTLTFALEERNAAVSPATVGRLLSRFDLKGYTQKCGCKGRSLTSEGAAKLSELHNKRAITEYSNRFIESLDVESKDNLIDILIARRGVERETARLAALYATDVEIGEIKDAYENRFELTGVLSYEHDHNFHRAIARASKNKVLAAAYDFIWRNGSLSPVMEFIRASVGGVISRDHGKILNAIAERSPAKAEKYMVKHIESLISDVHTYWNLVAEKPDGKQNR